MVEEEILENDQRDLKKKKLKFLKWRNIVIRIKDAKFGLNNRLDKSKERFVNSETYMDKLLKMELRDSRVKINKVETWK